MGDIGNCSKGDASFTVFKEYGINFEPSQMMICLLTSSIVVYLGVLFKEVLSQIVNFDWIRVSALVEKLLKACSYRDNLLVIASKSLILKSFLLKQVENILVNVLTSTSSFEVCSYQNRKQNKTKYP